VTSFDAGRGCPFQCSFCTIINVQGRKSRYRSPDSVEHILRMNWAQGVNRFFITDDNFARNKDWEAIYDRIIKLREEDGMDIRFMIQVDTLCHKIPNFIEKSKRAGVTRVFIGLENINPESLLGTKKRQNKIWEYREMLQAWRKVRVMTYAGYILGFPTDTPESIARDIETIKRELPIDVLEFFFLTPLPGSEDHKNLLKRAVPMSPDMNIYDLEHVCTAHPKMSKEQWQKAYHDAWASYYSPQHAETIMRRAYASGLSMSKTTNAIMVFSAATTIEMVHPLQLGIVRRKDRTQRRYGMPLESPLIFYPRRAVEMTVSMARWATLAFRLRRLRKQIERDPEGRNYMDEALTPLAPGRLDHFVEQYADKIPHTHGAPVIASLATERQPEPAL
jgi:radical SAM family protein